MSNPLEIKDLHVSYGGIKALRGVSLEVPDKKIVTLIGANGAGKSTLLRTISGLVKAESGSISFDGTEIMNKQISSICEKGIALVPEGRLRAVPTPQGALMAACRNPLRRRAADAGRRKSPDEQAQDHDDG